MKNLTTLFSFLIFSSLLIQAEIFTVSNNGFVPAQYTTIQNAIDAASSGDTIYISGSATAYSAMTIRKPLTIIGAGYDANFLSSAYATSTGTVQLGYDPTNGTEASGSTIIGLSVSDYIYNYTGAFEYGIDNITVRNCNIGSSVIQYANADNPCSEWLIEHNVAWLIGWQNNTDSDYIENCVIRNNIIVASVRNFSNGSTIIDHNIFTGSGNTPAIDDVQNLVISNNIFLSAVALTSSSTLNMFVNNIYARSTNCDFSIYNNDAIDNICLATAADVLFVDYPLVNGHSNNHDYHLQAGSPAIGAANDGTDIGIYGGVSPFPASFGGQPSGIPTVESLEILNPQLGTNCNLQFQSTGEVNP